MGERRPLGILANPASGKDIRRLVAGASVFDNREKTAIVRRALAGAEAAGVQSVVFIESPHRIVEEAIEASGVDSIEFRAVEGAGTDGALDTVRGAGALREAGCGAVIVLGGDGTNRAFALGWRDAPLMPVSTGTNNVFPRLVEGTVAGMAAGLVAAGSVEIDEVATMAPAIEVRVEGERDDLALVDAVLLDGAFVGARAIWSAGGLRLAVVTRSEPAATGMAAIAGLCGAIRPPDAGLAIRFGPGRTVLAPIAPGLFADVAIAAADAVAFDQSVEAVGPGLLAFDGERERVLRPGQRAWLTVRRQGPRVINAERAMAIAACRRLFDVEREGGHGR